MDSDFTLLLGFVDHGDCSGGEPVCELLRPGKAGSNTAADHIMVLDAALTQLPAEQHARDETGQVPVLVRTDAAGATKEFAAHLHEQGVEFSVGASFAHLDVQTALAHLPEQAWTPGLSGTQTPRRRTRDTDRTPRRGLGRRGHRVDRAERMAAGHQVDPAQGTPAPRRATTDHRHRRATNDRVPHQHRPRRTRPPTGRPRTTPPPPRPRRGPHPRRRRTPGCATCPSTTSTRTASGSRSPRWTRTYWPGARRLTLPATVAGYEPKRLRLRILATAGRLVHSARRHILHIDSTWPWAETITAAHTRLRALAIP